MITSPQNPSPRGKTPKLGPDPAAPPATQGPARAFVLGAGLGTRLRPLTRSLPKPLIPVFQKRLVTFAFDHLLSLGVREIIVNTHHAAAHWARVFPAPHYGPAALRFIHEPVLLETGGGIRNAAPLLRGEPFWVYNGDTLTDLPLARLAAEQAATGADVVIALRSSGGPLKVAWDPASGRVLDIAGLMQSGLPPAFLFTGHYLATPALLDFLEPGKIESVIHAFIRMLRAGRRIRGVLCDEGSWFDLGNRASYLAALRQITADPAFPRHGLSQDGWRQHVHPSATVAASARLEGLTILCEGASAGPGARLRDTILFPGARAGPGVSLDNCIVGEGQSAPVGSWTGADF